MQIQLTKKSKTEKNYLQYAGRALEVFRPEVLEELKPKLLRPTPEINHYSLFPAFFKRFCEIKGILETDIVGTGRGQDRNEIKRLFIGVMLTLYDPVILTGIHSDVMRPYLREELTKALQVQEPWMIILIAFSSK